MKEGAAALGLPGVGSRSALPRALLAILAVFVVWEVAARVFAPADYLVVPWPTALLKAMSDQSDTLLTAIQPSALEALLGLLLGASAACVLAFIFTRFPVMESALANVAVTVNALPWLAIAPLLTIWFGVELAPKVIVAALATFFPVLVNTTRGLKSADPHVLEFLYVIDANEWQTFVRVRLVSSLPHFFAGLKIAAPQAVLGATVAEWMGSRAGIGAQILSALLNYDVLLLWSAMIASALLAALFFAVALIAEHLVVGRWAEPAGEEDDR